MNKTALKNFATSARKELIEKVKSKAFKIGITEENIKKAQFESSDAIYIDGKQLSANEKKQREKLISRIKEIGYQQVVEEVAYTWFNRFTALRFMEVNNYLPTKVRVLSSSNPESSEPDIIKEALTVDLDINKELVYELKINNKIEELFKYLVIKQCNSLNKVLPFMFETIDDYKEILFPDNLLAKDSFIREMTDVTAIPESDWGQVEVIGWLYQYYISEKKDHVFDELKKNIKISKENIPAATQLFTPHWIVKYMVENSLGRLWFESYPDSTLKSDWKYYLEEAEQENDVKKKLKEIRYKNVNPEDITFLDPCCGSGHILVYAFDIFYEMYLEKGYISHEIPKLILEKNLYGIDIDDRAAQLASFALVMKAREKSRRIFGQEIALNICSIQETNWMTDWIIEVLIDKQSSSQEQYKQQETLKYLKDSFKDAKEFGSILEVKPLELGFLEEQLMMFSNDNEDQGDITERIAKSEIVEKMPKVLLQVKMMCNKYNVVCTNPPYMNSSGMSNKLSEYVKKYYPDGKSDLFAVFIEKCLTFTKENGFNGMITMHSWMFLSSFETIRKTILDKKIINMIHVGFNSFPELNSKVAQAVAFIVQNNSQERGRYISKYLDLTNKYAQSFNKEKAFFAEKDNGYYLRKSNDFSMLPESPIAYWVTDNVRKIYNIGMPLGDMASPRQGLATGENERFLRVWHEVNIENIGFGKCSSEEALYSKLKWFPYNKGGAFRKWYGNIEFIVNWENDGYEIKNFKDTKGSLRSRPQNIQHYFQEGITWSKVTSSSLSLRYVPPGVIFDVAGTSIFGEKDLIIYLLGLLNSKVSEVLIGQLSQTLNFEVGHLKNVPVIINSNDSVKQIVENCVELSKMEWDFFETSWDFKSHPLLSMGSNRSIKLAFEQWNEFTESQFTKLKQNEEGLNQIFIEIYGLQDELTPDVSDGDITIRKADCVREVKSFISYAVGCMLGRFSLDKDGLVFAGGDFAPEQHQKYPVDKDNVLPILSGAYFEDDIVSRFIDFVKMSYCEETLEENLEFIAGCLGKREEETAKETIRRYLVNDFYKDHLQLYKKRPIYWLFSSGKQKAFNCLIYMHRYDRSTLSRIRTDYLHELQIRLDVEKKSLLDVINGVGTAKEITNAKKELKSLELKIEELRIYDEKLHHMADMQIEIDLDDGVAVNYAKFEGLLAPIK